jgi:hypothetical protein
MSDTIKTMTPTELATKLAGKDSAEKVAKTFIRPYLRRNFARSPEARATSWALTPEMIKAVSDAYKARKA